MNLNFVCSSFDVGNVSFTKNKLNLSTVSFKSNDTVDINSSKIVQPLTDKEILNIKPKEFKNLLHSRGDIPKNTIVNINTPEELAMYDEVNNLMIKNKIQINKRQEILKNFLFKDANSVREVVKRLIPKNYDIEFISKLQIDKHNKNIIENIIDNKKLINSIVDKKIKKIDNPQEKLKEIEENIKNCNDAMWLSEYERDKQEILDYISGKTHQDCQIETINKILQNVDEKNIKYLDEYYSKTNDANFLSLPYWNKNSGEIYNKYFDKESKHNLKILEKVYRNGHTLDTIKSIYGDDKINDNNSALLEFKNYNKYKDLKIEDLNTLTIQERKDFTYSFINAINPVDWYRLKNNNNFDELKSKMKILENLDISSKENFEKSYSSILKTLLNSIPNEDREIITKKVNWNIFGNEYNERNAIPALVDDISALPYKKELINGKEYKIVEISKESDLSSAMHCMPSPNSIMNIEILEFSNPKSFICVGQRGKGNLFANGSRGSNDYALFIEPRKGNDLFFQSYTDVDSGCGASRNIYSFSNMVRTVSKNCHVRTGFSYIPELIKQELNLSQAEYTKRMDKLKNCTNLNQISKIDCEMEKAIRKILKENKMYEGLVRPNVMGIKLPDNIPLSEINQNILDYIDNHENCRLVRII